MERVRQVVIKHKNLETCYFTLKVGISGAKEERKYSEESTKSFIFFKINKLGLLRRFKYQKK